MDYLATSRHSALTRKSIENPFLKEGIAGDLTKRNAKVSYDNGKAKSKKYIISLLEDANPTPTGWCSLSNQKNSGVNSRQALTLSHNLPLT